MTRLSVLTLLILAISTPCYAYVGPGVGLGVLGTLFGILAAILLAVFGLLWYPLKRAFRKEPNVIDGDIDAVDDEQSR